MRKKIKNSILLLIAFLCMSVNLKEFSLFEKVYADTWDCTKPATKFTCTKTPGNKQYDCSASNFSKPSSACPDGTTYVKDECQKTENGGSCDNPYYGTQNNCEYAGELWIINYKYTGSITCKNYCEKGTLSGGLCKLTGQSSCDTGWTKTATCDDGDVVGNNCAKTSSTDLSSSGWSCTKKEDEKKTWKCTKCKDRTDYECTYLSNGCTGSDCYTASEKASLKVNSAGCPCEDCSSSKKSSSGGGGGGGGGGGNSETTDPTNQDNPYNPQTGTGLILVVWIIGASTIGYSIWYYKKINKQIEE